MGGAIRHIHCGLCLSYLISGQFFIIIEITITYPYMANVPNLSQSPNLQCILSTVFAITTLGKCSFSIFCDSSMTIALYRWL